MNRNFVFMYFFFVFFHQKFAICFKCRFDLVSFFFEWTDYEIELKKKNMNLRIEPRTKMREKKNRVLIVLSICCENTCAQLFHPFMYNVHSLWSHYLFFCTADRKEKHGKTQKIFVFFSHRLLAKGTYRAEWNWWTHQAALLPSDKFDDEFIFSWWKIHWLFLSWHCNSHIISLSYDFW